MHEDFDQGKRHFKSNQEELNELLENISNASTLKQVAENFKVDDLVIKMAVKKSLEIQPDLDTGSEQETEEEVIKKLLEIQRNS